MGARCTGLTQHKERILYKERHQGLFSGPYNSGKSIRNLLFLGLEGAGKTTLLYTTLVPNWSSPLLSNIKPTETFHYEVFHYGHLKFGMWEVCLFYLLLYVFFVIRNVGLRVDHYAKVLAFLLQTYPL